MRQWNTYCFSSVKCIHCNEDLSVDDIIAAEKKESTDSEPTGNQAHVAVVRGMKEHRKSTFKGRPYMKGLVAFEKAGDLKD